MTCIFWQHMLSGKCIILWMLCHLFLWKLCFLFSPTRLSSFSTPIQRTEVCFSEWRSVHQGQVFLRKYQLVCFFFRQVSRFNKANPPPEGPAVESIPAISPLTLKHKLHQLADLVMDKCKHQKHIPEHFHVFWVYAGKISLVSPLEQLVRF